MWCSSSRASSAVPSAWRSATASTSGSRWLGRHRRGIAVGALAGLLCAVQIVGGALRRGGTRGGTGVLVAGSAFVVAALAWIPVAGYVEAVALPVLAVRLRRARPERYAGLRTLARDE